MAFHIVKADYLDVSREFHTQVLINPDSVGMEFLPQPDEENIDYGVVGNSYRDTVREYCCQGRNRMVAVLPYKDVHGREFALMLKTVTDALNDSAEEFGVEIYLALDWFEVEAMEAYMADVVEAAWGKAPDRPGPEEDHLDYFPKMVFTVTSESGKRRKMDIPDELYRAIADLNFDRIAASEDPSKTPSRLLARYLKQKNIRPSSVAAYLKGYITRSSVFDYCKEECTHIPNKYTLVFMCFGCDLDYDEAEEVMASANYTLDENDPVDHVFLYGLKEGLDLMTVLDMLRAFELYDFVTTKCGINYQPEVLGELS